MRRGIHSWRDGNRSSSSDAATARAPVAAVTTAFGGDVKNNKNEEDTTARAISPTTASTSTASTATKRFFFWRRVYLRIVQWLNQKRTDRRRHQHDELCRKFFFVDEDMTPRTMETIGSPHSIQSCPPPPPSSWGASSSSTESSEHQYRGTFTDDDDDDNDSEEEDGESCMMRRISPRSHQTAMFSLIESILNGEPLTWMDHTNNDEPSYISTATPLYCFTDADASTVLPVVSKAKDPSFSSSNRRKPLQQQLQQQLVSSTITSKITRVVIPIEGTAAAATISSICHGEQQVSL